MSQQQSNEELRQKTEVVLAKVYPYLNDAEWSLLCWHCGIDRQFIEKEKQSA